MAYAALKTQHFSISMAELLVKEQLDILLLKDAFVLNNQFFNLLSMMHSALDITLHKAIEKQV